MVPDTNYCRHDEILGAGNPKMKMERLDNNRFDIQTEFDSDRQLHETLPL